MAQEDAITFEALPQRIGANKAKRRRKGDPPADAAAAAAAAPAQEAAAAAAQEAAEAAAPAAQAAAAAAGALSTGFGLHNIGQQQQREHEQQQQPHVEDAQQYRSAAVGEHKFEYLDHTADVQLHAWGSSLQEAFEQVGLAMVNYMTPIDGLRIDDACTRQIHASGHDLHSLLFNWLDELLFSYATEYIMFGRIDIDSFDTEGFSITATGRGEKFDRARHECGTEVKAITYSAMQIRQAEGDAEAEAAVQRLDTANIAQLWRNGYAFLDVRTPQEFAAGHVPRAVNVPWVQRDAATSRATPNPNFLKQVKAAFPAASTNLIVACQTGQRSQGAARLLGLSYPQMVESRDGYVGWVAAGLPTTS